MSRVTDVPGQHTWAAVRVDHDLQIRRVQMVLAGGGDAAVTGRYQGAVHDQHRVFAW